MNQCDGCQAGIPLENGCHRMGKPGGYPNRQACTKELYTEVERLGERCIDGGKCHHGCSSRCFRRECCAPFSTYTGPWAYEVESSKEMVSIPKALIVQLLRDVSENNLTAKAIEKHLEGK